MPGTHRSPGLTRRRYQATAATLAAGGALAACAPFGTQPAAPSEKEVTITYITDWSGGARKAWLDAVLPLFKQENPKITVQTEFATTNIEVSVRAAAAAGTLQDTALTGPGLTLQLAEEGQLQDITPVLKAMRFNMNDLAFAPSLIQIKGKQYGMPLQGGIQSLVINKTLFKQAGADLPTDKTTWPQLLDLLRRVARPSENIHGFMSSSNHLLWHIFVWGFGGDRWSADRKKTLLDQAPAIEGLQFYVDMMHRQQVAAPMDEKGNIPAGVSRNAGNLAISWSMPTRSVTAGLTFEVDFMYHPLGPRTNKRDVPVRGQPNTVTVAAARHGVLDQAVKFITWLCASPTAQNIMAESGPELPTLRSVLSTQHFLAPPPASMKIALDQLSSWREPQNFKGWDEWGVAVTEAMLPAFSNQKSVVDAAKEATRAGDLVLAKYPLT